MSTTTLYARFLAAETRISTIADRDLFRAAIAQICYRAGYPSLAVLTDGQAASLADMIDRFQKVELLSARDAAIFFTGDKCHAIFGWSFLYSKLFPPIGITITGSGVVFEGDFFLNTSRTAGGQIVSDITHNIPFLTGGARVVNGVYLLFTKSDQNENAVFCYQIEKHEIDAIAAAGVLAFPNVPAVEALWDDKRGETARIAAVLAFAELKGVSHDFHSAAIPIRESYTGRMAAPNAAQLVGVTDVPRPPPPAPPPPPPDDAGPTGDGNE